MEGSYDMLFPFPGYELLFRNRLFSKILDQNRESREAYLSASCCITLFDFISVFIYDIDSPERIGSFDSFLLLRQPISHCACFAASVKIHHGCLRIRKVKRVPLSDDQNKLQ